MALGQGYVGSIDLSRMSRARSDRGAFRGHDSVVYTEAWGFRLRI
jgi:hypothetical protein